MLDKEAGWKGGCMARFVEDMTRLHNEIMKGYTARNQMIQKLHLFANELRDEVTRMRNQFVESHVKMTKKGGMERKAFVFGIQQKTIKIRNDFAKEIQEARRIWSSVDREKRVLFLEKSTKKKGIKEKETDII